MAISVCVQHAHLAMASPSALPQGRNDNVRKVSK